MDFRELLEYNEKLNAIDFIKMSNDYVEQLKVATSDIQSFNFNSTAKTELLEKTTYVQQQSITMQRLLSDVRISVQTMIAIEATKYYDNYSEEAYNNFLSLDYIEYKKRTTELSARTESLLKSRIGKYVGWNNPTLQVRPLDGLLTDFIVGGDPLYLVDVNSVFFKEIKTKYTNQYQDRLRFKETTKGDYKFSALPQNQIGFALCWNMLEFVPAWDITNYLSSIYDVLKPGGIAIISYNNCERPGSFQTAEINYRSFILKTDMVKRVTDLGYEIIATFDEDSTISWIEVKKPGELTSNRAGQTLASIINVKGK